MWGYQQFIADWDYEIWFRLLLIEPPAEMTLLRGARNFFGGPKTPTETSVSPLSFRFRRKPGQRTEMCNPIRDAVHAAKRLFDGGADAAVRAQAWRDGFHAGGRSVAPALVRVAVRAADRRDLGGRAGGCGPLVATQRWLAWRAVVVGERYGRRVFTCFVWPNTRACACTSMRWSLRSSKHGGNVMLSPHSCARPTATMPSALSWASRHPSDCACACSIKHLRFVMRCAIRHQICMQVRVHTVIRAIHSCRDGQKCGRPCCAGNCTLRICWFRSWSAAGWFYLAAAVQTPLGTTYMCVMSSECVRSLVR